MRYGSWLVAYLGCALLVGCAAGEGSNCGPWLDYFAEGARDCSAAEDRVECMEAAEADGNAWRIDYDSGTIDGPSTRFVIGTAAEHYRDAGPFVVARRAPHADWDMSACEGLELSEDVWLSHSCMSSAALCAE